MNYRRSKDRRTEASKVRSGSMHQGILEIGKTIKKMDSGSSITRMETSMRVCGRVTRVMDRALTGEMRLES